MIQDQRVRVNGVIAQLGTQVDPDHDRIEVDGRRLPSTDIKHHYIALNKPVGVVSTAQDPEGRPSVVDLVGAPFRLYPVGRLDIDSEGLVLLTDDGELTFRLTHARFGVEKEYRALVRCEDATAVPARLQRGVVIEDGMARAARAQLLSEGPVGAWMRVILTEGRNRQVRRMLAALGCAVVQLQRVRIGSLVLGDLPLGCHRQLQPREVASLRELVGLPARG
jgi:23S rRNA pseudouridine2605 synthase